MNRWSITLGVLAVAFAASLSPAADTQGRGEGGIVIVENVPTAAFPGGQTRIVKLGQTIAQVDQTLGAPQKILKAGGEVTYVYQELKVTFEDGKVAELQ